jgi:hypothetical protein
MLDWTRKDHSHPDHAMRNPASAAKLLAELRGADPLTALSELSGWIDSIKGIPSHDEGVRSEVLSLIHDASEAHLSALLGEVLAKPSGKRATGESSWQILANYLTGLTGALYTSARVLLKGAATDASLHPVGAAGAARCLHACRTLAKACLVRYLSVPPKMWRLAYVVHDYAEKAGCAATPVHMHAAQKTTTTVTQELLRLLMLQSSMPEMMPPEQIEVADRVIEQLGADFTLRPRGVADNPFCFDASSDRPPRRAADQPPDPDIEIRYFGAGTGLDALERLYKQLVASKAEHVTAFGKDIVLHAQISAIQHLLAFWGAVSPYSPPVRSPATGKLTVVHRYAQVWQHLSRVGSATSELSLVEDDDSAPGAVETWTLQDTGGKELGVEISPSSSDRVRCGDVVSVSMDGNEVYWLGVIRSIHAEWGRCPHANIAILSCAPQAMELRAVIEDSEQSVYSEETARQFAFNRVRAIILSDGSGASQTPNLLLAPESWKEGRVYEATVNASTRYLRGVQLLRHTDEYVRATFEWVAQASTSVRAA